MVATVVVKEMNASPVEYTTVDAGASPARYKTKDEVTSDLNYPCVIAASGLHYSYWKSHCLDLSGSFTRINNVRFYTDGTIAWTLGTGGLVQIGQLDATPLVTAQGVAVASYDQATGTEGITGDDLYDATNGHASYKVGVGAAPVNVTTFVSATPMIVDLGNHDAAEKTKYIVTQVVLDDDATQGLQADETFTWMYDECAPEQLWAPPDLGM
jgi:hypothetical protein